MNDRAHTIDIDTIVLTGVDLGHAGDLGGLVQAEVRRALSGWDLNRAVDSADAEARVAGEVAGTVVRSVQRGSNGV
jgi:hypothetical protein